MTRSFPRRRNGEAGAELIEFALVFPLLLMMILGIVDFSLMFQRYEVVTNAVREGARVAVLPGYTETDVQARVASYIAEGGLPTTGGNPTVTVTATTIPDGGGTWPATTVAIAYVHDYSFVGALAGWFSGSLGPSTLQVESTMRDETAPSP